ncbi:MAG TPA: pantoate--beta-alanine ligase [Opitutaceae bacterium]|nr:pantoate--beta-alanine ligase [Opitutaceae bacterium]
MEKIESIPSMRALATRLRAKRGGLSLVPTMGALHAGHEALISAAWSAGGSVVVSIFVNPLSFGSNENFAGYPRSLDADLAMCSRLGVSAAFVPSIGDIYPRGYSTYVTEEHISKPLCGISRPTHFRGVATFVAKLLNIVGPDRLYLGQKDAQHVAVLRKMAADLNYDVEIVVIPTVREADGLAAAVRNSGLMRGDRQDALAISKALKRVKEMVDAGVLSSDRLVAEATHIMGQHRRVRVIYVSIVDPNTMEAVREVVPGKTLICVAAWLDEVRFTDNAVL